MPLGPSGVALHFDPTPACLPQCPSSLPSRRSTHCATTEDLATELATHRGQAVKAYLAEQNLPEERLFIAAPKTTTPGGPLTPRPN
ncbi:MAG: hypothetical protein I8H87_02545 [Comamonadaceae bacterium]|nr:hypothetical protein [Comamonadaceae bacterium]